MSPGFRGCLYWRARFAIEACRFDEAIALLEARRAAGSDNTRLLATKAYADGQAVETILVMTQTGGGQAASQVERYLLDEVIPFAERNYRINPTPQARYIAGNSSGAMHARNIGFLHPELFSAIGIMGGGGLNAAAAPLETTYEKFLDSAKFNVLAPYTYIAVGERDRSAANIVTNVQRLRDSLDRLGIRNTFRLTTDAHSWFNWRRYLAEFVRGLPNPK